MEEKGGGQVAVIHLGNREWLPSLEGKGKKHWADFGLF